MSAAPAYATSCDVPTVHSAVLVWGTGVMAANQATYTQVITAPGASESVTVTATAAYVGRMAMGDARDAAPNQDSFDPNANFKTAAITTGEDPERGLTLAQYRTGDANISGATRAHYGLYTFTFDPPVKNVSFRIADVDAGEHGSNVRDYSDAFVIQAIPVSGSTSTNFTVTSRGARVTGTGTGVVGSTAAGGDPIRYSDWERIDDTDERGHVTFSHTGGAITGFAIQYWNSDASANEIRTNQTIKVGQISFQYEAC